MNLVFHYAPRSSAIPVAGALAELKIPHEVIVMDLAKGDQKKPTFLALNPNGKVPTLIVDGTPMFEALAIQLWLGETFGVERKLWPAAGTPERLTALSWCTWAYVTYGGLLTRLQYAAGARTASELHSAAQAELFKADLAHNLDILEARLRDRDYVLGASFTLVDVLLGWMITYGTWVGSPIDKHPIVSQWIARLHKRESFRKLLDS